MSLNEQCFQGAERERWLLVARGMAPAYQRPNGRPGFVPARDLHGMALRSGGMAMPVEFKPPLGQYYYRFLDTVFHTTGVARFGGAAYFGHWWVAAETLAAIRRHARLTGDDLSEAAKYYLALPYAWGDHRRLVRALLVRPLRAWRGRGLPAHDARSGTCFIPPQHVEVAQLFIPGDRDIIHQAFAQADCLYTKDADRWFPS
jgi:hypothetical protein